AGDLVPVRVSGVDVVVVDRGREWLGVVEPNVNGIAGLADGGEDDTGGWAGGEKACIRSRVRVGDRCRDGRGSGLVGGCESVGVDGDDVGGALSGEGEVTDLAGDVVRRIGEAAVVNLAGELYAIVLRDAGCAVVSGRGRLRRGGGVGAAVAGGILGVAGVGGRLGSGELHAGDRGMNVTAMAFEVTPSALAVMKAVAFAGGLTGGLQMVKSGMLLPELRFHVPPQTEPVLGLMSAMFRFVLE